MDMKTTFTRRTLLKSIALIPAAAMPDISIGAIPKPQFKTGTIGHQGHGKSTLTAALVKAASNGKIFSYTEIANAPEKQMFGVSLAASHVSYEDAAMVFRHVIVASFLTYGWAQIPYSVWMKQPWSNCIRFLVDVLIYAVVTAGTFAMLWPG